MAKLLDKELKKERFKMCEEFVAVMATASRSS
jgi:hypothetical protein